jgi:hypothetical protein
MIRYARTYGSKLFPEKTEVAWQFPTGPAADSFGVTIPKANKTFGLEEFNFNKILRELKLAFVPCYGNAIFYARPTIKELNLIYKIEGRVHAQYATLRNVTPILDKEISDVKKLLAANLSDIYFNRETQIFFNDDFENFRNQINFMFNRDSIAANQIKASFLVNLRYEDLTILKNPVVLDVYPGLVGQWKANVNKK